MLGELTARIKLHAPAPLTVTEALRQPRLVRKQLEIPLVMTGPDNLLIGRDEERAGLVIPDIFISRTHAAIICEKGKFYLQDLHSKNGTFLNEKRLPSGERSLRPLRDGDRLRFNLIEFRFVVPKEQI